MSIADQDTYHLHTSPPSQEGSLPELTRRELSVLTHIVRGYSHKEIGEMLGIAMGTVNVFVHRIRLKTRAKSRRDLILAAAHYGIHGSDELNSGRRDAIELTIVEQMWPKVPNTVRAAILSLVQAVGEIGPEQVVPPTGTQATS